MQLLCPACLPWHRPTRLVLTLVCPACRPARSVHAVLTRGEAEALLADNGLAVGVFLLRAKDDGTHVMTICTSAGKGKGKVSHCTLRPPYYPFPLGKFILWVMHGGYCGLT